MRLVKLRKSRVFYIIFRVLCAEVFEFVWICQDFPEVNRAALNLTDYLGLKGIQILDTVFIVFFLFLFNGLI